MHIAAFVSRRLLPYVSAVETASVKTGFNGTVTNKGSSAIAFTLGSTSYLFCSAHLEAHTHNVAARNDGWKRIELELCKKLRQCRGQPTATMASQCFDRVVFMGDLNYRVAEDYKVVCEAIARDDMACLLRLDQLHQVMCNPDCNTAIARCNDRHTAGDGEQQRLHWLFGAAYYFPPHVQV